MKSKNMLRIISVLICCLFLVNSVIVHANPDNEASADTFVLPDDEDGQDDEDLTNVQSAQVFNLSGEVPEVGAEEEAVAEAVLDDLLLDENPPEIMTSENEVTAQEELADTAYVPDEEETEAETEEETEAPMVAPFSARMAVSTSVFTVEQANTTGTFTVISTHGSFDEAKAAMESKANAASDTLTKNSYVVKYQDRVVAMVHGMAFATGATTGTLTLDGSVTYVVNTTSMYYFGTTQSGSTLKATVGISGYKGTTAVGNLLLVPYPFLAGNATGNFASTNVYERDYYINKGGELYHYVTTLADKDTNTHYESGEGTSSASILIDRAPSFMAEGTKYYSMDGTSFYTDSFLSASAGTYYSYYQYLSFHTKSNYSANDLNNFISSYVSQYGGGKTSVLTGQGSAFIKAQEESGINALLELAFACHESAYGTSSIATSKNNLFGINATDENPGGADKYSSVYDCVEYHARRVLKQGYFDAKTDSRYYGTHAGNKQAGINVKYASDPYHGEKLAGWAYRIDKHLGSKDYGTQRIGIAGNTAVYKDASKSTALYNLNSYNGSVSGFPVVILGESGSFYKVQSDMPIVSGTAICTGTYSYNHVGYVEKAQVNVVRTGSSSNTGGGTAETEAPNQTETEAPKQTDAPKQTETEAPKQTDAPKQTETEAPKQTDAPKQTESEAPKQTDAPKQTESEASNQTDAPKQTESESSKGTNNTSNSETNKNNSGTNGTVSPDAITPEPEQTETEEKVTAPSDDEPENSGESETAKPKETELEEETKEKQTEETAQTEKETNSNIAIYEEYTFDLAALKDMVEENKVKDVVIDVGKVTFTFKKGTMSMDNVSGDYFDFDTKMLVNYSKIPNKSKLFTKDDFVMYLEYAYEGKLPGTAEITIEVGKTYSGKTLHYYYIGSDSLTFMESAEVDADGYITVSQDHCSNYSLFEKKLDSTRLAPKTGDTSNTNMYVTTLLLSLAIAISLTYFKKSQHS